MDAFNRLSVHQYATGWVLCQIGRACYEMVDYPAAAKAFEWARQSDAHRIEVVDLAHCPVDLSIPQQMPGDLSACFFVPVHISVCSGSAQSVYMHAGGRYVIDIVCIPSRGCLHAVQVYSQH